MSSVCANDSGISHAKLVRNLSRTILLSLTSEDSIIERAADCRRYFDEYVGVAAVEGAANSRQVWEGLDKWNFELCDIYVKIFLFWWWIINIFCYGRKFGLKFKNNVYILSTDETE